MHALIIEDQFLIATLIGNELEDLGFESWDIVCDEAEAILAADRRCPDIIAADDRLASGSGIAAVRRICSDRVIPVVFIIDGPHAFTPPVPFASVIGKPFTQSQLREAVGHAVVLAERYADEPIRDLGSACDFRRRSSVSLGG